MIHRLLERLVLSDKGTTHIDIEMSYMKSVKVAFCNQQPGMLFAASAIAATCQVCRARFRELYEVNGLGNPFLYDNARVKI